jgi:hypothetical protein
LRSQITEAEKIVAKAHISWAKPPLSEEQVYIDCLWHGNSLIKPARTSHPNELTNRMIYSLAGEYVRDIMSIRDNICASFCAGTAFRHALIPPFRTTNFSPVFSNRWYALIERGPAVQYSTTVG